MGASDSQSIIHELGDWHRVLSQTTPVSGATEVALPPSRFRVAALAIIAANRLLFQRHTPIYGTMAHKQSATMSLLSGTSSLLNQPSQLLQRLPLIAVQHCLSLYPIGDHPTPEFLLPSLQLETSSPTRQLQSLLRVLISFESALMPKQTTRPATLSLMQRLLLGQHHHEQRRARLFKLRVHSLASSTSLPLSPQTSTVITTDRLTPSQLVQQLRKLLLLMATSIAEYRSRTQQLAETNETERSRCTALESELSSKHSQLMELARQLEDKSRTAQALHQQNQSQQSHLRDIERTMTEMQRNLELSHQQRSQVEAEAAAIRSQLQECELVQRSLQKQLNESDIEQQALQRMLADKHRELQQLSEQSVQLSSASTSAEQAVEMATKKYKLLMSELQMKQSQLMDAEEDRKRLQNQLAAQTQLCKQLQFQLDRSQIMAQGSASFLRSTFGESIGANHTTVPQTVPSVPTMAASAGNNSVSTTVPMSPIPRPSVSAAANAQPVLLMVPTSSNVASTSVPSSAPRDAKFSSPSSRITVASLS